MAIETGPTCEDLFTDLSEEDLTQAYEEQLERRVRRMANEVAEIILRTNKRASLSIGSKHLHELVAQVTAGTDMDPKAVFEKIQNSILISRMVQRGDQ